MLTEIGYAIFENLTVSAIVELEMVSCVFSFFATASDIFTSSHRFDNF